MRNPELSRRDALRVALGSVLSGRTYAARSFQLATFTADVTPPIGEPLLGGIYEPALRIDDPLYAKGFVLLGADKPLALVAVDFLEIRNASYERWKTVIAEAAGTDPSLVLVTSLHQHNAPLADTGAQTLLEEHGIKGKICDAGYHEQCAQHTAEAVRQALRAPKRVTHFGIGQGRVDRVASNRGAELPDGKISFHRNSFTEDPVIRNAPEGLVDPYIKTLSFWDDSRPVAALSCYSVHAQTHFSKGDVTSDFTGLARERRQQEMPDVFQLYTAGCSGDTTVGKYNDGETKSIPLLAERLRAGMAHAWEDTQRHPLTNIKWRSVPLSLKMYSEHNFSEADEKRVLSEKSHKFAEYFRAAEGLSWRHRAAEGHNIEIPLIDFGAAQILLAPGETFVQYQLWAQEARPESFVMVMGYGECAPGYIPTKKAVADGWNDYGWDWMWADPSSSEDILLPALRAVLRKS